MSAGVFPLDFVGVSAAAGTPQLIVPPVGFDLFSPAGYLVGVPVSVGLGHGGSQISIRQLFYMQQDQLARVRERERLNRQVQRVLVRQHKERLAKHQEIMRRNWAATYTTLLAEV